MVEAQLQAQRGAFHLDIACAIASPWSVVFGPSGAGKSTLLRLIAGLESPDHGRIAVHGEYITDTAIGLNTQPGPHPGQRRIGMITQQSALFPHLTVRENIAFGLAHLPRSEQLNDIEVMLDLVGAAHLASRYPTTLSGGEAQRVSLARALAPAPRLLLLDEPLSALDAAARDQLLGRLQSVLSEHKIQAILVTHDAADALDTQAEVLLLEQGKLIAQGPASEVLATERDRLLTRLSRLPATSRQPI